VLDGEPGVADAGGFVVLVDGVSTGGVEGSEGAALVDGLALDEDVVEEVSELVPALVLAPPAASGEERTSEPAVLVAAVLAAEPVEAIDHQSLLARCFGEAFM
jgi:hypothetical protein